MSAPKREHMMPPRPLMPWTMALCAGLCVSCVSVLNVAADAMLGEQTSAVGPACSYFGCGVAVHGAGSIL